MSRLKIWLRVSRFNFLPASLFPYALGGAFASRTVSFRTGRFLFGLLGTALVHLGANLLNEYWDFRLGADRREEYQPHFGGSKSIQTGAVSPPAVRRVAWICLGGALLLGSGFSIILKSPLVIALVAGGTFIAWSYTARPLSLAYRGWGELSLFIAFGPLLVAGGYYLQAAGISQAVGLLSLSPGLLIAALLMANEIADAENDARAGKRNLAVRWGRRGVFFLDTLLIGCAYAAIFLGCLLGLFPVIFLLILVSAFWAKGAIRALSSAIRTGTGYRRSSTRMMALYNFFHLGLILLILFS